MKDDVFILDNLIYLSVTVKMCGLMVWTVVFFSPEIMEQNGMSLLLLLFCKETLAQNRAIQGYESTSSSASLDCTKAHGFDGISEVGCAVVASRMPIYNFGFILLNETCMICRAGGTPGDPTVLETTINGTIHVDGEMCGSGAHA